MFTGCAAILGAKVETNKEQFIDLLLRVFLLLMSYRKDGRAGSFSRF